MPFLPWFPTHPAFRWSIWTVFLLLWTTILVVPGTETGEWPLFDIPLSQKSLVAKTAHVCGYAFLTMLTGWLKTDFRHGSKLTIFG